MTQGHVGCRGGKPVLPCGDAGSEAICRTRGRHCGSGSGRRESSWLNEAAERALLVEAGLCAVAEWEAEHGTLTEGELAEADRFLAGKQRRRAS